MQIEEQVFLAAVRLAERILASIEWESSGTIKDANVVLETFYTFRNGDVKDLTHTKEIGE